MFNIDALMSHIERLTVATRQFCEWNWDEIEFCFILMGWLFYMCELDSCFAPLSNRFDDGFEVIGHFRTRIPSQCNFIFHYLTSIERNLFSKGNFGAGPTWQPMQMGITTCMIQLGKPQIEKTWVKIGVWVTYTLPMNLRQPFTIYWGISQIQFGLGS